MNAMPGFFFFHVKLKPCVIADRWIHSHVCEIAHLVAIVLYLVSMETKTIICELLFIYFIFLSFSVKVRTQSQHEVSKQRTEKGPCTHHAYITPTAPT